MRQLMSSVEPVESLLAERGLTEEIVHAAPAINRPASPGIPNARPEPERTSFWGSIPELHDLEPPIPEDLEVSVNRIVEGHTCRPSAP